MRTGAIIYPLLSDYGELTDLVATSQMFALRAEQPTEASYLVYREVSSIPLNTKGASIDTAADPRILQRSILDTNRVQISVFADTYLRAEDIAVKVREALDREWGTVNAPYDDVYVDSIVYDGAVDDYDDTAANRGWYVKHLDFIIRVVRQNISNTWTNNYSLAFDGVDDYVTFGDNDLFSIDDSGAGRGFSLSIWIKLSEISTQWIVNKNGAYDNGAYHYEWLFSVRFNGQIRYRMYFNDSSTNYVDFLSEDLLVQDRWYHIVITYNLAFNQSSLKMYIDNVLHTAADGAEVNLVGVWGEVENTHNPMYLARSEGTDYAPIQIDEFSLWDEVLSADDVDELYGEGRTGDPNRYPVASNYLLGYWRCGDGSVFSTINDASPQYSNNGEMINMDAADINTDVP